MITQDAGATTLYYTDADGHTASVSWWERAKFQVFRDRYNAQQKVKEENERAKANYLRELTEAQDRFNSGIDATPNPPAKPKEKLLSDMGVASEGEFNPPLPDPVYKPRTPLGGKDGKGNPTGAVPDHTNDVSQDVKLDAIMAAVAGLLPVLHAIDAKLDAMGKAGA